MRALGRVTAALAAFAVVATGCGARERAAERDAKDSKPAKPDDAKPASDSAPTGGGMGGMAGMMAMLANAKTPGYWDEPRSSTGGSVDDPHLVILELSGEIAELESFSWTGGKGTPLRTVTMRILELAGDEDTSALLLRFGPLATAMAHAEELRGVIAAAAQQKPVHCFTDGADNLGYYLLSACTTIGLTPTGEIAIPGPLVQPMYFKGLFDKVGVKADFLHMGAFKGAAEPLTRTGPSDEMRQTYGMLLDGVVTAMVDGIATGRKLSPEQARAALDTALFSDVEAKAAGLVDSVATFEAFRDEIAKDGDWLRVDLEAEDGGGMGELMELLGAQPKPRITAPHVAVIYAVGDVVDGRGENGKLGATSEIAPRRLVPALRAATADDSVKAIVLRVDSPGGSALASETIWHAVDAARQKKPVVISMGSLAASGGYYISAPGSVIFAQPNTLTGSIGVVGGKIVIGGALERFGVTVAEIGRGKRAGLMSTWRPWNPDERSAIDKMMREVYTQFKARVAQGRGKTPEQIEPIAQGRVWTGAEAKKNGLVDEIGGLDAAIAEAKKRGGLAADAPLDVYPPDPTLMDILSSFGGSFGAHVGMGAQAGPITATVRELAFLLGPGGERAALGLWDAVLSFRSQPVQVRAFLPLTIQ